MEPTPLVSGRFALYQTPKGGMHLSLLVEGEVEPRHVEIPAMMVKMMMRKTGQNGGFIDVPAEIPVSDSTIDYIPLSEIEDEEPIRFEEEHG